jgi:tyrosine-protein phosphatase YwqE
MFSWLNYKKNKGIRSTLFEGMTDVHTHLLPGVDDGAQFVEDSVKILHFMCRMGVRRVYLTPHVMADLPANTPGALQKQYEVFLSKCPGSPELRLAAEYMLDSRFTSLINDGLLAMSGRHVLVETSYLSPPLGLYDMLYDLRLAGYQPLIAHPERYLYMQDSDYRKLKEQGCKLQLNLFSLTGVYGSHAVRNALYLLKQGLYDHAGSDVHHLDGYREGIAYLSPSRSQVSELERIIANNQTLWE